MRNAMVLEDRLLAIADALPADGSVSFTRTDPGNARGRPKPEPPLMVFLLT
jgi:hypothetical protein